jgi:hypothetical protein
VKKVVYPVKYQSYEPDLQHSYTQTSSLYEGPAQTYSNEHSSQSEGNSVSYSSLSFGGVSEGYGH